MADSALFQSYRATEKAKAERALDEALGRLDAAEATPQPEPEQEPQPEPQAGAEQPEERQPGVFESLKRGVQAVPKRFMQGIDTLGGVIKPLTPEERGEAPVDPHGLELQDSLLQQIARHPAARTVVGVLDTIFPFSAFAGEVGGDIQEWLAKSSGELTDEKLQQARAFAEKHAPGTVSMYDALLAIPYEQRVEQARQAGAIAGEVGTGFIPGYTAAAKGVGLLTKGGKAAKPAAAPAKPMLALPPGELKGTRSKGAIVSPGPVHEDFTVRALEGVKPEHRMTQTEIVMRALEERRAMERMATGDLGEPGANRVAQNTPGREALRQEFRTPLDANDSAVANEIVNATRTNGGATYSVHTGMHPGDRGFAVSPYPERGAKIRGELRDADIVDFVRKNEDLLADERHYVGTWRDETGVTHLDVSIVVDDLDEAIALGKQHNQLAVYDFKNGKSIDLPEPERMLGLEHYSPQQGLTRVDPEKFGTGQAGRETARAGDPDFQKRSYYYVEGAKPEARFAGLTKYSTEVPESKILDISSDAGKAISKEAGNNPTKFEKLARDRGYLGYRDTQGDLPDAVAVFEPLDVRGPKPKGDSGAPSAAGLVDPGDEGRAALAQSRRNDDVISEGRAFLASRGKEGMKALPAGEAQFDPHAFAQEKGLVYQGQWQGADFHEFREERFTKGGNFTVPGPLTREAVESSLAEHYTRFGVNPAGEVGAPVVDAAKEARERLKTQWEIVKDLFSNEAGAYRVTLRGDIGSVIDRQTMNDLVTVGTEIMWQGARGARRWAQAMIDEFGDTIRPLLKTLYPKAQARIAKVVKKSPDMKSVKQVLQYFHDGEFAAGWYDKAADELRAIFGENADLYANLLAATSPHNTVPGNVTFANKAMEMILTGERSAENPFTAADFGLEAHRQNLNRILAGQPIEGPKVGPFARAIMGDEAAVVVDTWMLRAFGFPETGIKAPKIDASRERILFIEKTVKDIANRTGLTPRQVQAAIWTGKKIEAEGVNTLVDPLHQVVRAKLVDEPYLSKLAEEFRSRKMEFAPGTQTADDLGFESFSKMIDDLGGEEGRISMTTMLLLTRASIGAAVGAMEGDNPEQRAFNALLGAGVGSVLSRKLAQKIWQNVQDTDLVKILQDESGAINPRKEPTPGQKLRAERKARAAEGPGPSPNTERMDAPREVKQAARSINERLSQMKRLLRDETLSHDETIERALKSEYRDVEKILGLEDQTTFARVEDGVAARDARDLVIEDLLTQAARAKESGDPTELAKVRQQGALAAKVSEKVTNATTVRAQAQEAQKIPSRASRAKAVDYNKLAEELAEYRSGLDEAMVSDKDFVDALLEMGERAKAAKLLEDSKKVPSAFWKIYYGLNLLSTPLFHPKNVIGNTGALTLSIGARMMGEIISYPFQLAGVSKIGSKALIAPGETFDLVIGTVESVKDAWTAAKNTWATGESMFRGAHKYADRMDLISAQRAIQQPGGAFQVMVDGAARLAGANLRFAGSTDEFYKVLAFAAEQRALSRRKAWTSGLGTWKEAIEEQARLLRETPRDIIEKANDFAEWNTFTKAFDRDPSKLMSRLGATRSMMATLEDVASQPWARLTVAPFFRTPMRIAEFGTEFTPVLNLIAPSIWKQAMGGGAGAFEAVGKIAMSAGMTYVLSQFATAGLITGDWSKDPALRNRQKESGFKPWSVYLPLTGKYQSYAGLGPIVAPIAAAAQYAQMAPHLKDSGIDTQFMAMMLATMETNLAMPYFDALNDFVQIFEGYDDDAKIASGIRYVADRLRTFVPAAGLMRSVATALDGEVKDLKEFGATISPEWRDVFNLFSSTMANLPGLSRLVPAYRNIVTGEPIPLEGGPLPGLISTPTDDPVQVEILELGGAGLPREIPRHIGGQKMPEGTFRVYGPKAGAVEPLTHEQRTRLGDLLTKGVKLDGKNLHQALAEMIVGPSDAHDEYVEQSDGARGGKALMIHDLWNAYLDEAEARLLDEDKGLQETIRRSQAAKQRLTVPPGQLEEFDSMVEEAVR